MENLTNFVQDSVNTYQGLVLRSICLSQTQTKYEIVLRLYYDCAILID